MTEKELLHKRERKARRRRERNNTKVPKSLNLPEDKRRGLERYLELKKMEHTLAKDLDFLNRVQFGVKQLKRLGEPLIEESKQREIEANLVD